MRYLIIALLMSGCGSPSTEFEGIDQAFEPYIELLSKEFSVRGRGLELNLPINFKDLGSEVDGLCKEHKRGGRTAHEIFINPSRWEGMSDDMRLAVLTHEIGHCVYGRGHDDEVIELEGEQALATLMFNSVAALVITGQWERHREYYFNEFIGVEK